MPSDVTYGQTAWLYRKEITALTRLIRLHWDQEQPGAYCNNVVTQDVLKEYWLPWVTKMQNISSIFSNICSLGHLHSCPLWKSSTIPLKCTTLFSNQKTEGERITMSLLPMLCEITTLKKKINLISPRVWTGQKPCPKLWLKEHPSLVESTQEWCRSLHCHQGAFQSTNYLAGGFQKRTESFIGSSQCESPVTMAEKVTQKWKWERDKELPQHLASSPAPTYQAIQPAKSAFKYHYATNIVSCYSKLCPVAHLSEKAFLNIMWSGTNTGKKNTNFMSSMAATNLQTDYPN